MLPLSTLAAQSAGQVADSRSFNAGSTAGNATVTNNGGTVSDAFNGRNLFEPGDAGNATLIANGGSNGGEGGFIQYRLLAAFHGRDGAGGGFRQRHSGH